MSKLTEQSASCDLGQRYVFHACHLKETIREQKSPGAVGVCLKLQIYARFTRIKMYMKNKNSWGFVDATNALMTFKQTGYLPLNICIPTHSVTIYTAVWKCPVSPQRKQMEFL